MWTFCRTCKNCPMTILHAQYIYICMGLQLFYFILKYLMSAIINAPPPSQTHPPLPQMPNGPTPPPSPLQYTVLKASGAFFPHMCLCHSRTSSHKTIRPSPSCVFPLCPLCSPAPVTALSLWARPSSLLLSAAWTKDLRSFPAFPAALSSFRWIFGIRVGDVPPE